MGPLAGALSYRSWLNRDIVTLDFSSFRASAAQVPQDHHHPYIFDS